MSKLESIEHYTGVIRGRLVDIERNAGDQHEKVKKLQAERDELKRQVKVWERLAVKVEQEDWEHAEQQATTVPRAITADEMKAGQKLAIESVGGAGDVFTVQSVGTIWEGYPAAYKTGGSFWAITEDERIWLLEDAPDPAEGFPKRLTVEDLDAAPVGSRVTFSGSWLIKDDGGTWMGVKAEDITSMNPDRTLTPPEKPARRGEPIKEGDTVRTVAELDGLAHGSVVLDYFGDAHQKADGLWWEALGLKERDTEKILAYGPFTVLYLPEEDK